MKELTNAQVEEYFGDVEIGEYENENLVKVFRAKTLLSVWREHDTAIASLKERYQLAVKFEDDKMKNSILDQGKPLIKRIKIVEDELKVLLPQLKNEQFLLPEEKAIFPKWINNLVK